MTGEAKRIFDTLAAIDDLLRDVVDLDDCLREVTDALLWMLGCDRAFAWSPNAPELGGLPETIVVSRTEAGANEATLAVDDPTMRALIDESVSSGAVKRLDAGAIPPESALAEAGVRSVMIVAIQPRLGPTWLMGVHVCASKKELGSQVWVFHHLAARLAEVATCVTALQQLRAAEEREAALLREAPDAVLIIDIGTQRVVNCNAAAERILDWPTGQLLGVELAELNPEHQDDGAVSDERITVLLAEVGAGEERRFSWTLRQRNGNPVACAVDMTPLPSDERLLARVSLRLER